MLLMYPRWCPVEGKGVPFLIFLFLLLSLLPPPFHSAFLPPPNLPFSLLLELERGYVLSVKKGAFVATLLLFEEPIVVSPSIFPLFIVVPLSIHFLHCLFSYPFSTLCTSGLQGPNGIQFYF